MLLGSIRIGLHTIMVYEMPEVLVGGVESDGSFSAQDHIICIRAGIPGSRQREILVHEMLHLCYMPSGLDDDKRHAEETVCTRLASSFAEIINRNPWVALYLQAGAQ